MNKPTIITLLLGCLALTILGGCGPVTQLVCPPGSSFGSNGQQCTETPRPAAGKNTEVVGIGDQESDRHSHLSFPALPHDITRVSSRISVDVAPKVGLNYFAVQVNFPNNTWAHGGIQLVDNRLQANWGGLVNRGGGKADYEKEDPARDLAQMQNPRGDLHTGPYAWTIGREYLITIERGRQVTLPPGDYIFIGNGPRVHIPDPRVMWEWNLSIAPVGGEGPIFQSTLYDSAETIKSFIVWNECGYGACHQNQHASWSIPTYRTLHEPGTDRFAGRWLRF